MRFQIKRTREYLQSEERRLWKQIERNKDANEEMEEEMKFIQKCREEINQANKILRANEK